MFRRTTSWLVDDDAVARVAGHDSFELALEGITSHVADQIFEAQEVTEIIASVGIIGVSKDTVKVPLCESPIPVLLYLRHNLRRVNILTKFLQRNGNLVLPKVITLQYNKNTGHWQGNLHYSGFSPTFPTLETWDVVFEFGSAENLWRFSTLISKTGVVDNFVTRFLAFFRKEQVCESLPIDFTFRLQPKPFVVSPSPAFSGVLIDEVGLGDINVIFNIRSNELDDSIPTHNITKWEPDPRQFFKEIGTPV